MAVELVADGFFVHLYDVAAQEVFDADFVDLRGLEFGGFEGFEGFEFFGRFLEAAGGVDDAYVKALDYAAVVELFWYDVELISCEEEGAAFEFFHVGGDVAAFLEYGEAHYVFKGL
ncbi:hypothetical protein SDC9_177953 [bioreactor metagenome]|uniref:Uncharacterized protein n=1 Tax=bioreactor metagenome TaxID=1076179 RepID=A0A645GWQ8_9ZZZZ